MISFEIYPLAYEFCIFTIIVALGFFFVVYKSLKEGDLTFSAFLCILTIIMLLIAPTVIITGNAYTEKITICAHTLQGSDNNFIVVDTNGNEYLIRDTMTKLKIVDGSTITAHVQKTIGSMQEIYKIDEPLTCANASCMVK